MAQKNNLIKIVWGKYITQFKKVLLDFFSLSFDNKPDPQKKLIK